MPAFGFSAFLKLLSFTARRQRSAIAARLQPSEGGYDFHAGFRRLAGRYLAGGETLLDLLAEADAMRNPAEGRYARAGLEFLAEWRDEFPGRLNAFDPRTYESPSAAFKVRYTPDFGIEIDGQWVAVHIWKTRTPDLDARMTYVALSLFERLYDDHQDGPDDLAVLSLPDRQLLRLSDVVVDGLLAGRVVTAIERMIEEVDDERRPPSPPSVDDQPRLS